MLLLILVAIFGVLFAYFATLNDSLVTLYFGQFSLEIPIYLLILASSVLSILIAGVLYLVKSLSSSLTIGEKESELKETKKELAEVTKELHKLELENTKFKAEMGISDKDDRSI